MSDDFFEDDVVEEKPEPKKPQAKKLNVSKATKEAGEGGLTFSLGMKLDLTWVIAIAIVAFAIGFVAHAQFFKSDVASTSGDSLQSGGAAPALTPEQIDQYQQKGLPKGHPNIGGTGDTSATPSDNAGQSGATNDEAGNGGATGGTSGN